mmetsp:Transcript_1793/g.3801  ORF Transcript_1793/g.3801 Transcript_1793/m.3801 type:complete len:254 (-) Transcript_1793:106-867(-)
MPVNIQKVLCPFNLMPWLKAPRSVDVGRVVLVILPINFEVDGVVLPNKATTFRRQLRSKGLCQNFRAIQVALLASGFKCCNQCLAHVHVGVLPAIAVVNHTFSADGVQVRTLVREPKFALQHVKDASYVFVVLHNPRRSSGCMGSKDKGIAISLLHHVLRFVLSHCEGITLLCRHIVHLLDILQTMFANLQQLRIAQKFSSQHEIDHHSSARNDLPKIGVEFRPIDLKALEEAAARIQCPRLVERNDVADMLH